MKFVVWGGLALLALLTFLNIDRWTSNDALWSSAAHIAPMAPRPIVNLAVDRLDFNDLDGASFYLDQAERRAHAQTPDLEAWSMDLITANRAAILLRQDRLTDAVRMLAHAHKYSAGWELCRQLPNCVYEAP